MDFKFKDIERALYDVGFKRVNNNGGSHQKYKDEALGSSQPIPEHPGDIVTSGTAKNILDQVIFTARVKNINICSKRYGLPDYIKNYIMKCHAKIKENIVLLIPEDPRKQFHIETTDEANAYYQKARKQWASAQKIVKEEKSM